MATIAERKAALRTRQAREREALKASQKSEREALARQWKTRIDKTRSAQKADLERIRAERSATKTRLKQQQEQEIYQEKRKSPNHLSKLRQQHKVARDLLAGIWKQHLADTYAGNKQQLAALRGQANQDKTTLRSSQATARENLRRKHQNDLAAIK